MSASISRSSASRDGIGMPFSPLCCSSVDVAKPMAPARTASSTMPLHLGDLGSVAARLLAWSPSTQVRTDEWPTNDATFRHRAAALDRGEILRIGLEVPVDARAQGVERHALHVRQVAHDDVAMAGRQGAMVKPQLPMTTVVTPRDDDGVANGSQVSWAS